jgi:uncharacterized protein
MENPSSGVGRFFALAFAITWGLQLPGVLAERGVLPGNPALYLPFAGLGIFGPLVAAAWMAGKGRDGPGVRALFGQLLNWRAAPTNYLVGLFVPGLLLSLALLGFRAAGRTGPIEYFIKPEGLVFALVISVVEEIGWRGYALPRLQERMGPFAASILIGALWYLWHIPMFLGQKIPLDLVLVMLLFFTGGSLFFTWLYNRSAGCLPVAIAAHLGAHLNNSHRALPGDLVPLLAHAMIYAALGFFLMRSTASAGGAPNQTAARLR